MSPTVTTLHDIRLNDGEVIPAGTVLYIRSVRRRLEPPFDVVAVLVRQSAHTDSFLLTLADIQTPAH